MSAIIDIRETEKADLSVIMDIHRRAFGGEGEVVANLTRDILADPTARPVLSLLAERDGEPVGHILFSNVRFDGLDRHSENLPLSLSILAPLGVLPEVQGQGVGGDLIRCSLEVLAAAGVGLVFVLGHPGYYPRFGFSPAGKQGFDAPYPIPAENADAWMVEKLGDVRLPKGFHDRIICCEALSKPEYWRE
ncbi:GNAT family N-acetyltransferase [Emcibacter sp.]|uniref:GNAT family N-acetyltransferase n=1 Tax=Emcibacter sp. TaxID=1979954 RepID=UPI003A8DBA14